MKKKLLLLLGLCGLIFPTLVKADMGAPEIRSYEVVISNVDGAKAIGDDKVIPYETKCTVNYEDEYDGFLHLEIMCPGEKYNYTIDAKDARILKDQYLPEKDYKLDKTRKYYVFKDLDMYRGPSYKYEKIDKTIPTGSIIEVSYVDYDDEVWGYTEYDGKKGWVYIYWYDSSNKIARVIQDEKKKDIITVKNITKLYKYPNDEKPSIDVSIPPATSLKSDYYYQILKADGLYYIEYNGVSGWIDTYDGAAIYDKSSILVMKPEKIKVYDSNYKSINLRLKEYQELEYDYRCESSKTGKLMGIYRVTYEGKQYYIESYIDYEDIYEEYENYGVIKAYSEMIEIIKSAPVYETYEKKKVICTVKVGETYNKDYSVFIPKSEETLEQMYYIKTNEISGWVSRDSVETHWLSEDEDDDSDDEITTTIPNTTTKNKNDKVKEDVSDKAMGTKEIVIICISGAVILALVTIVVIVLINRKKANKKENISNLSNSNNDITNNDNLNELSMENKQDDKETNS